MYEDSLRIPLLVRWPGTVRAGARNSDIVLNLDFASTLLEAAGAKIPADVQGRSLVSLLRGKTPDDWRTSMYYRYYLSHFKTEPHYGVRTKRHKLIHFHRIDHWELFDLESDANELVNLYELDSSQKLRQELVAELTRLRKQLGDEIDDHGDKPRTGFER